MRWALLLILLTALSALADGLPNGWFVAGREDDFVAAPAPSTCGLPRAVTLRSKPNVTSGWATAMQLFDAGAWRGQRLRLSATVATRNVKGWAGLWMRVDGAEVRAFDNMQNRPLKGTLACATHEVVLDVPPDAVTVAAGVVLEGSGELEVGGVRLDAVPPAVATTDLLSKEGFKPGPPGQRPEEKPNELHESLGRVGGAWFNHFAVQSASAVLHQRNPRRWSDRANDSTVTVDGDTLRITLGAEDGVFRLRREGDATLIEGEWGKQLKYPVTIRLSRAQLDMKWGFYERHLTREDAPQVDPECVRFVQYKGTNISASDAMYVCGVALEAGAPPVQLTVAFLLEGFRRTLAGPAMAPPPGLRAD